MSITGCTPLALLREGWVGLHPESGQCGRVMLLRQLKFPLLPLRGCAGELGLSQPGSPGITQIIFCVFLETDFNIYKKKMSVMFQDNICRMRYMCLASGSSSMTTCQDPVTPPNVKTIQCTRKTIWEINNNDMEVPEEQLQGDATPPSAKSVTKEESEEGNRDSMERRILKLRKLTASDVRQTLEEDRDSHTTFVYLCIVEPGDEEEGDNAAAGKEDVEMASQNPDDEGKEDVEMASQNPDEDLGNEEENQEKTAEKIETQEKEVVDIHSNKAEDKGIEKEKGDKECACGRRGRQIEVSVMQETIMEGMKGQELARLEHRAPGLIKRDMHGELERQSWNIGQIGAVSQFRGCILSEDVVYPDREGRLLHGPRRL
ncbi:unnamed protein product [Pleuronectes platessa]|uniref:Uncharacterized protein n=1 Tax=Pleuronectes platessa TaxID=8262 RepID=A0A9N7Z743_PLEPL|nr:unnamed protein product [Pleuronectes platessa]